MAEIPITTIIFDVDDTLYDVGTGFTAHRNEYGAQSFMVAKLNFPDNDSAKLVRDEYFLRYHSTAKALTVAEQEGRLPPAPLDTSKPRFNPQDLAEWWATNLDFSLLGGRNQKLVEDLSSCPLKIVAFSNGPRKYVKRVLVELGLWELFGESRLFAVDDVLPHCKPEPLSFQVVLDAVGATAKECVMVEDSMKNIRVAKELGMKTVLVTGLARNGESSAAADAAEATKAGDAPCVDDPAVDFSIETMDDFRETFPSLWETPAAFEKV